LERKTSLNKGGEEREPRWARPMMRRGGKREKFEEGDARVRSEKDHQGQHAQERRDISTKEKRRQLAEGVQRSTGEGVAREKGRGKKEG